MYVIKRNDALKFSDVVSCGSSSCSNNGVCSEEVGAGVTCICDPGWTGTDCSTDINECDGNPCENGGTCADGENMFTCTCPAAWSGLTCGTGQFTCIMFSNHSECIAVIDIIHTHWRVMIQLPYMYVIKRNDA